MAMRFSVRATSGTGFVLALLLAACASGPAPTSPPDATAPNATALSDITAISTAGPDNAARRNTIRDLLAASEIKATEHAFSANQLDGTNLIADVSGDAGLPLLLIGAHFDQVEVGRGVTDNASGSTVALALARRFQQRPLAHHRVAVAFWDLEERGLLGANAYVTGNKEKPALYINFDVFGWGDTLWMMTPDPAHPLVASANRAAQSNGISLSAGDKYPPTDHLAFLKAGWPAVSFSLVGADEIPSILQVFSGSKPATMPKVMRVIHSEGDTLAQIDGDAIETGIDAVEAAIRAWDAGQAAH